ncbi:mechanosensitive ion channel family protein [Paenibacillus sp. 32O-W]|uniref:mechanosensitive ion channel family protein n=1 Tax=Paenibacillus sp. 32O-W TaxID=1695218 RepID=UPI0007852408|nr:mechanosensitive ion channel family protein [Paenibacillus sp. 32O-W]
MEWGRELGIHEYFTWDFWAPQTVLLLKKLGAVSLIVALTWFALRIRKILISRIFVLTRLDIKQKNTLESLLLSLSRYVLFIIAFLMCLSNLGLEVGPIIAGAGVVGLAVGFGAQSLVKDLITGFFIIFEDQFSVGDYVSINNGQITGTVVSVGLRATKIRTWAQHVVVIQNSEIRISENYNREKMRAIINVTVPYETDPADVETAVNCMSERLLKEMPHLFLRDAAGNVMEPPQLYGITDVENQALGAKYTVVSLVNDQHYWTACKEIRRLLLHELKERGIPISYPRRIERIENEFKYGHVTSTS